MTYAMYVPYITNRARKGIEVKKPGHASAEIIEDCYRLGSAISMQTLMKSKKRFGAKTHIEVKTENVPQEALSTIVQIFFPVQDISTKGYPSWDRPRDPSETKATERPHDRFRRLSPDSSLSGGM
jgi:hypothetical protein